MKKSEIKVGGYYTAKISGQIVTVKVNKIEVRPHFTKDRTHYDVTNQRTGRHTTFLSAQKFRARTRPYAPGDEKAGNDKPKTLEVYPGGPTRPLKKVDEYAADEAKAAAIDREDEQAPIGEPAKTLADASALQFAETQPSQGWERGKKRTK